MSATATPSENQGTGESLISRLLFNTSRRWFLVFGVLFGLYVTLPMMAPVFMRMGWTNAGNAIYLIYSTQCHQLPQRSFFLFGQQTTYALSDIQTAWRETNDPLILRQFTGNLEMGWKFAWSDRMVSMYTSLLLFALLWRPLRKRAKGLPWWGFVLLLLPMAVDGSSHFLSDFAGIGQGFRDSNLWLANLTGYAFSPTFYSGDAWGSFNSIMRLLTGILFGLGVVWFGFPHLDQAFQSITGDRAGKASGN